MSFVSRFQNSFYSALIFFGTLLVLSAGYATWNSTMITASSGSTLSSSNWNVLVDNVTDLDSRWTRNGAAIVFTGGNVGIGTVSPDQKLSVAGIVESTSGGFKFPDATVQTKAFQGIMTIRTNNIGTFSLANGWNIAYTASCQADEIATGGGCGDYWYKDIYVWQPSATSYYCAWYNTSGASRSYVGAKVTVNCLK